MNLLLDTHVFLWLKNNPKKVSKRVLDAYYDVDNKVFLSIASVWEMQIKCQLGKLELNLPLSTLIEEQCLYNELQMLPIKTCHIFASADEVFHQYPVDLFW